MCSQSSKLLERSFLIFSLYLITVSQVVIMTITFEIKYLTTLNIHPLGGYLTTIIQCSSLNLLCTSPFCFYFLFYLYAVSTLYFLLELQPCRTLFFVIFSMLVGCLDFFFFLHLQVFLLFYLKNEFEHFLFYSIMFIFGGIRCLFKEGKITLFCLPIYL